MKVEAWVLTSAGIAAAVAVPLIVNYQNRKQARQIELFRKDPSVGLIPPPHPLWVFLGRNWMHFFYPPLAVYYFYRWTIEDSQHSYHAGVSAALFTLYLMSYLSLNISGAGLHLASRFTDMLDGISHDTNRTVDVLAMHNEMLSALLDDFESHGLLSEGAKARIATARKEARSASEG
jgi:hypothetical protein